MKERFIFNPEHDLCLANGDANFVPPASALKFGEDCPEVVRIICSGKLSENGFAAWGWNAVLKKRLMSRGVPELQLPSDGRIADIRNLSHRRTSMLANMFIRERISDNGLIVSAMPEEMTEMRDILKLLRKYDRLVLKSPWSGSGKGIRWVSRASFRENDAGWCRNLIGTQGSLFAECREDVTDNFAMLFSIKGDDVKFEGLSLFDTENGMYRSSCLASDGFIFEKLSRRIPAGLLEEVKNILTDYLGRTFAGRYEGCLGVDMFICRSEGHYLFAPCVEINVRMTMGMLARKIYDDGILIHHYPDGSMRMEIVFSNDCASLYGLLSDAVAVINGVTPGTHYAIAVFRNS